MILYFTFRHPPPKKKLREREKERERERDREREEVRSSMGNCCGTGGKKVLISFFLKIYTEYI